MPRRDGSIYRACPKCSKELDIAGGQWVADHPDRSIHGYRISQLFSARVDPGEILRAYQVGLMRKQHEQRLRERMLLRPEQGVRIVDLTVASGSAVAGAEVGSLKLHQSTGLIAINRGGRIFDATSHTVLEPGDSVSVFCRSQYVAELEELFADATGQGERN